MKHAPMCLIAVLASCAGEPDPLQAALAGAPLHVTYESYYQRDPIETPTFTCLSEDDSLDWRAEGSLAPGEELVFTPSLPGCHRQAGVWAHVVWSGAGTLELSSEVTCRDSFTYQDLEPIGRRVTAPVVTVRGQNLAQLCMFPGYSVGCPDGTGYSIRIRNTGDTTVDAIAVEGRDHQDWQNYTYDECFLADADGDGWNDASEYFTAKAMYYASGSQDELLTWGGPDWLEAAGTATADDEVDGYAPDLDDDDVVGDMDRALVESYLGEGTGVAIDRLGVDGGVGVQYFPWRRADLNGDGSVDGTDLALVDAHRGPVPLAQAPLPPDQVPPTVRLESPADGSPVKAGSRVYLDVYAWDARALTALELVDARGRTTDCASVIIGRTMPMGLDLGHCWWQAPKKQGTHRLTLRATDAAGNTATTGITLVTTR